jgi:hypothetical protein
MAGDMRSDLCIFSTALAYIVFFQILVRSE